jgi:hypothetical protein
MYPAERSLERIKCGREWDPARRVRVPGINAPLKQWRAAHRDKSFFELQIEVCQRALLELPDVKDVSADDMADCRKRLEAEIETLRRTKRGIFGQFRFPTDRYSIFDEGMAKELRDQEKAKELPHGDRPCDQK